MALLYPTGQVDLTTLTRAALKHAGPGRVQMDTGPAGQAVHVPDDVAHLVLREVGLGGPPAVTAMTGSAAPGSVAVRGTPEPAPAPAPDPAAGAAPDAAASPAPAARARAAASPPPDPDTTRPADRPGGRAAKKTTTRRTARRKEG